MASELQIAANRQNSQRSTGAKTLEGKARVSLNPLKHGLTGKQVVLPSENPEDFDSFRTALWGDLAPQGALEEVLVEKIIADAWRLRRVPLLEAALYLRRHQEAAAQLARRKIVSFVSVEKSLIEELVYEAPVVRRREPTSSELEANKKAEAELAEARAKLGEPSLQVISSLEADAAALTYLWRHENSLERSFLKALHELQRLQAMRAGEQVAPPEVLDMNVTVRHDANDSH